MSAMSAAERQSLSNAPFGWVKDAPSGIRSTLDFTTLPGVAAGWRVEGYRVVALYSLPYLSPKPEILAELIDCVSDAQSLLAEIDQAVRAEHKKNGAPQSKSVAGVINERLSKALARVQGGAL